MRRLFLLFCALTLVAAACGDDDAAIFTSTTAAAGTTTATTTAGAASTTTAAATTTAAGATTSSQAVATTTTGPTTATTLAPVTTHPGLPSALSRSLIPMDEIDAGWVAVIYSADTISPHTNGPSVVYLVSPEGDRFELAAFPVGGPEADQVGNLSNNGAHVATVVSDHVSNDIYVMSLEVATGAQRVIHHVEGGTSISTTLPTGRDVVILHTTFNPTMSNLEVYRVNGSLFADIMSLPSQFPGLTWLYGLDGTYLLVGDTTGLLVYSNDGTYVRTLSTPPGYCEPVRWWDETTILAACVPQDVLDNLGFYHVLWLIPLDGSPGQPLTAPPPANWDVVEFGHADAWRAGGQIILQWWGDCSARGIQILQPGGVGDWLTVEPSGGHWIHAQAGNDLVIHSISGCGDFYGPVSLIRPDGSLVRTLVPQLAGYQGVISIAGMIPVP